MRLLYKLYGKKGARNTGVINRLGGLKIGEGCIIMPEENAETIVKVLREHGVEVKSFDAYVSEASWNSMRRKP